MRNTSISHLDIQDARDEPIEANVSAKTLCRSAEPPRPELSQGPYTVLEPANQAFNLFQLFILLRRIVNADNLRSTVNVVHHPFPRTIRHQ